MSVDTETQPTAEVEAPTGFAALSVKEQHEAFALLTAFKSAFLDYEKEVKSVYGDTLFRLYEETGSKTFAHHLDDEGSSVQFTIKETQDAFSISDEDAFTDFVEEHHPAETDVKVVVRPAFATALLKRLEHVTVPAEDEDGEPTTMIVDPTTGLEVPGITFKKGGIARSNGFAPSWKKNGKQLAINAVMGASVDSVLPALPAGSDQ